MRRLYALAVIFVLVVLVSGCTDEGETETEVISKDMLEVTSIEAIPSDTINPGNTVSVVLRVENVGQDDVWMLVDGDAKNGEDEFNGDMILVNYCSGLYSLATVRDNNGVVKDTGFNVLSTTSPCGERTESYDFNLMGEDEDACYIKFMPGQTHVFQWKIKAPEASRLSGISNKCNLNFQTIYAGVATTYTYIYFASPREVAQRIYTDQDLSGTGDNIASYGPVYVNFETGEPQPISAGSEDSWSVYLNVNNVGDGIAHIRDIIFYYAGSGVTFSDTNDAVEGTQISDSCALTDNSGGGYGALKAEDIEDQLETVLDGRDRCGELDDPKTEAECEEYMAMKSMLEIYGTKTSTLSCSMNVPDDVFVLQSYRFKAVSHYSYSQGYDLTITTDPK